MADLTSRIEVQAIGRNWLHIILEGRIVGQLCIPDHALPGVLALIPLAEEGWRIAGAEATGGRQTRRQEHLEESDAKQS